MRENPENQKIILLIRDYFRSWSNGDISKYASLFMDNPRIIYIDSKGTKHRKNFEEFLKGQNDFFKLCPQAQEFPLAWSITVDRRNAFVTVPYEMTGPTAHKGVDYFRLYKVRGKWLIAELVWHKT